MFSSFTCQRSPVLLTLTFSELIAYVSKVRELKICHILTLWCSYLVIPLLHLGGRWTMCYVLPCLLHKLVRTCSHIYPIKLNDTSLHWLLTWQLDKSLWAVFQCIFSIPQCGTFDSSLKYSSNHCIATEGVIYVILMVSFLHCCILLWDIKILCCLTLFSVVLL